jgi:hypothetical protein
MAVACQDSPSPDRYLNRGPFKYEAVTISRRFSPLCLPRCDKSLCTMQAAVSKLAVPGDCPERGLSMRQERDRYARAPRDFTML